MQMLSQGSLCFFLMGGLLPPRYFKEAPCKGPVEAPRGPSMGLRLLNRCLVKLSLLLLFSISPIAVLSFSLHRGGLKAPALALYSVECRLGTPPFAVPPKSPPFLGGQASGERDSSKGPRGEGTPGGPTCFLKPDESQPREPICEPPEGAPNGAPTTPPKDGFKLLFPELQTVPKVSCKP